MNKDDIAIVTPLKNEICSLPKLFAAIENLDVKIALWVIVENDSDDGSIEWLNSSEKPSNVNELLIVNHNHECRDYALGVKYSSVVNIGFDAIRLMVKNSEFSIDYIGILDADCYPEPAYYTKLINFMRSNAVDISSGFGYSQNGKYDGESKSWVRGNCRLWKWKCFSDAGYIIGPSADALSVTKAELKGYQSFPCSEARYICRDVGGRVKYDYYGYSSYYRGITPLYALLKTLNYLRLLRLKEAIGFFRGYFVAKSKSLPVIDDPEIFGHFNNLLSLKFKKIFK